MMDRDPTAAAGDAGAPPGGGDAATGLAREPVGLRARRLARVLLVVVVLGALVVIGARVQWAQTWAVVRAASWSMLLAAAVVNMLSLALKGVRWWIFLRGVGVRGLPLAQRATFAGAALNNLVVANAGEVARVMMVSRASGVGSEKVLATLALERLVEFAGYLLLFAAAVSLFPLPAELRAWRAWAFVALGVLCVLLVWLARHPERAELAALPRTPIGFAARAAVYSRGFMRSLAGVSTTRRLLLSMLVAMVVWGLQVATYQMTARAAQFPIPVEATIACILAVNLGFAVRATPGNVGVFQAVYAVTAAAFGMDADAAVGVAMLIQAQQILPVTIVGLTAALRDSGSGRGVLGPPA